MTEAELLAAIVARPEDLLARLLYAERLEARGDPRGEFVRVQVALAHRTDVTRYLPLRQREERLLAQHGERWAGELARLPGVKIRWRAGFVHELANVDAGALLGMAAAPAVLADVPLRRLGLVGVTPRRLRVLVAQPWVPKLRHLALRGDVGDEGAPVLTAAPSLAGLGSLNVGRCGLGAAAARAFASGSLGALRTLALQDNPLGDEGVAALCRDDRVAPYRSLYLTNTGLTDEGIAAGPPRVALRGLEELWLGRNAITDRGVASLVNRVGADGFAALRRLDLHATQITDAGARALADTRALPALEHVDVSGTAVTRAGAEALRARVRTVRA